MTHQEDFPVKKIQEALQLFSEIEKTAFVDDRDSERLNFTGTLPPQPGAGVTVRTTPRAGSSRTNEKQALELQHLKKKLEVAEAVNKKLYAKNKELTSQIEELKKAPSSSDSKLTGSPSMPLELRIAKHEIASLKKQLEELMAAKVECIIAGEGTGKVNKEVKAFFVACRQRQLEDVARLDAERVLWNEKIFKLEQLLAEKDECNC